jgi:N-acetyl-anhydromuramyl-L-alanine amidase AmpD
MTVTGEQIQAREFFEQGLDTATSPWGRPKYVGKPMGAVIHYTADEDWFRVLRWFIDPKQRARVSAHAVVADRRLGSHGELAKDLPLIETLPATVIQVRPVHSIAWHATWLNGSSYGVENMNAGPWSGGRWEHAAYKQPVPLFDEVWIPFTNVQIRTNLILLRYVQQLFGTLIRPYVVGHELVQRGKRDPGPAYPLEGIREAVFDGWKPIGHYDWYKRFQMDEQFGQTELDGMVTDHVRLIGNVEASPSVVVAWDRFESAVRALPGKKGEFGPTGRTALRMLGYYVGELDRVTLDVQEITSVMLFQRMMRIAVDGVPGPITKGALVERLEERRFLKSKAWNGRGYNPFDPV